MRLAPTLLLLTLLCTGAPARGDDAERPPPPANNFDVDAYAKGLVARAKELGEKKDWQSALAYLRYVKVQLGGAAWVIEQSDEIDAAIRDAEDGTAEILFARAKAAAAKTPATAKPVLEKLRTDFGTTRWVAKNEASIEALEATVRTALWTGKAGFCGEALVVSPTEVRLSYGFDRIEELGDFDIGAGRPAPKIDDGAIASGKTGSVVRHRVPVPAGATFTAEIAARGAGKIAIILSGDGSDVPIVAGSLVLEVEAGRSLHVALRRVGDKAAQEAEDPRGAAAVLGDWKVRVERRDGRWRAWTIAPEDASGASVELPAAADEAAFRPGFAFLAGKCELDSLAVEVPLASAEAVLAAGAGARPPLPRRVWIELAKEGIAAFQATGRWTCDQGILRVIDATGSIAAKELVGRALDKYELSVDVRVENSDGGNLRAEPIFAIVLPVGERCIAWVIESREMSIDGVEGTRHLGGPAAGWRTYALHVTPAGVEAFSGGERAYALPADQLIASPRWAKLDSVALLSLSAKRPVEFREAKIKIE